MDAWSREFHQDAIRIRHHLRQPQYEAVITRMLEDLQYRIAASALRIKDKTAPLDTTGFTKADGEKVNHLGNLYFGPNWSIITKTAQIMRKRIQANPPVHEMDAKSLAFAVEHADIDTRAQKVLLQAVRVYCKLRSRVAGLTPAIETIDVKQALKIAVDWDLISLNE